MEIPSPLGLPLSMSDLKSPEKLDNTDHKQPTHHKLQPISSDVFKKRRKHRAKKSQALNDSMINSEAEASVNQLSKATDDDIQSYLNERLSRLDSIPDPLKLDPITTENQSKESRINGSVHQKTTPSPISGIGLLEPNMNESHSSSDNQPPLSDTKALSQSLSEVDEIERRRQRRTSRRAKKRQMSQNDEDESTLKPDDGGERRELPELSTDATTAPLPPSSITPSSLDTSHSALQYNLSSPTDPLYLVDEEDVHDVPAVMEGPMRVKGPNNGMQSNKESSNSNAPPFTTYRQVPETGAFIVNRQAQGEAHDGTEAGAPLEGRTTPFTNTTFTKTIYNLIKKFSVGAHGVLAGMSIWNSAVALTLLNNNDGHIVFLSYYCDFPLVLHSLFLLLLFFVIISIFDRIDISKVSVMCIQRCSHNFSEISLTIAMVLLLIAFTVTASVGFIDERIARFHDHPDLWSDILYHMNITADPTSTTPLFTVNDLNYYPRNEGQIDSEWLTTWLILDIIKTLAIFGSWLITSLCTMSTDNMEEYLNGLE